MLTIVDLIKNLNRENELLKLSEPPTIIRQTRAPLIIAKFESGFSIDIQFPRENFQTIRNTNYIRHCIMVSFFKGGFINNKKLFNEYFV